jgi:hypothetical protein
MTRFHSPRIHRDVRWLLLNFPAKALCDPQALPILLGDSLPDDVSFQLKVWAEPSFVIYVFTRICANRCSIFCSGLLSIQSPP